MKIHPEHLEPLSLVVTSCTRIYIFMLSCLGHFFLALVIHLV